jgi:hypothetical protein
LRGGCACVASAPVAHTALAVQVTVPPEAAATHVDRKARAEQAGHRLTWAAVCSLSPGCVAAAC